MTGVGFGGVDLVVDLALYLALDLVGFRFPIGLLLLVGILLLARTQVRIFAHVELTCVLQQKCYVGNMSRLIFEFCFDLSVDQLSERHYFSYFDEKYMI